MGRLFGYSRVSTSDQDWALQVDALIRAGVDERDIYREKQSGAKTDRVELRRVLDLLREGDTLVVWRLDRLARSQLQLLQIAQEVEAKNAELVSVMDRLDTSTATGRMLFGILGVLSEFERNLTIERSRAGQAVAKRNGKVFGRPQTNPFACPASEAGARRSRDDDARCLPPSRHQSQHLLQRVKNGLSEGDAMTAAQPSDRSVAIQNFHRVWPWLAYAFGLLLREADYGEAGAMVFMLGMLGHWRFWLLMIGCAAIGWWWGGRRHRSC